MSYNQETALSKIFDIAFARPMFFVLVYEPTSPLKRYIYTWPGTVSYSAIPSSLATFFSARARSFFVQSPGLLPLFHLDWLPTAAGSPLLPLGAQHPVARKARCFETVQNTRLSDIAAPFLLMLDNHQSHRLVPPTSYDPGLRLFLHGQLSVSTSGFYWDYARLSFHNAQCQRSSSHRGTAQGDFR
jgi:hypothetical protein